MQRFLAVIAILVLALGGLWAWSGGDLSRLTGTASGPMGADQAGDGQASAEVDLAESGRVLPEGAAQEGANAAADAAADAAAIAADVAASAVASADAAAVSPADSAAASAEIAAESAIAAADRAAQAAAEASAAPQVAPDAALDAGNAARDAAMATRAAGEAALQAVQIDAALTPEGFDAEKVRGLIDASTLAETRKAELRALLDGVSAGGAPALAPALAAALEQIKAALP